VPIEMDMYEIQAWKDGVNHNSVSACLIDGFANMPNQPGAATGLTLNARGVTIFDCPDGIRFGGLRVYKKTKYFLPGQATMTYQYRDPKNRSFSGDEVNQSENVGFNRKGMTRVLFFIWKALPNFGNTPTPEVRIGTTRKYAWTVLETSESTDRLG